MTKLYSICSAITLCGYDVTRYSNVTHRIIRKSMSKTHHAEEQSQEKTTQSTEYSLVDNTIPIYASKYSCSVSVLAVTLKLKSGDEIFPMMSNTSYLYLHDASNLWGVLEI